MRPWSTISIVSAGLESSAGAILIHDQIAISGPGDEYVVVELARDV